MYVYETINLINNKKYIGVKISNRDYDNYLGSGILLKRAIKKYGKNNFEKRILKEFNNEEEARNYERMLIEAVGAIDSDEYYNLVSGGYGGGVRNHPVTDETKEKIRLSHKLSGHGPSKEMISRKNKEFLQYGLDGVYIKTFVSKQCAKDEVGHIRYVKYGDIIYAKGYLWKFKDGDIEDKITNYEEYSLDYITETSKKVGKLTKEDVINLVKDKELGLTYAKLSEKYKVSPSCAYEIVIGKTYKWVWNGKI